MDETRKMNIDCSKSEQKEDRCSLKQFERNSYFYGKLMTVGDFELEQDYLNDKRHLINRLVHGAGIVCGLEVEIQSRDETCYRGPDGELKMLKEGWNVVLSAGTAIDCLGQEILVSKPCEQPVAGKKGPEELGEKFGVYVRRKDLPKTPVPCPSLTDPCRESCCYSIIEEDFEVVFDDLPEIAELAFDSSSYTLCDCARITLIEPVTSSYSAPEAGRIVKLYFDNKSGKRQSEEVCLDKCGTIDSIANVFGNTIDLKKYPVIADSCIIVEYKVLQSISQVRDNNIIDPCLERYSAKPCQEVSYPRFRKEVTEECYNHWLTECRCCQDPQDPKVLLAVLSKTKGKKLEKDEDLTIWFRDIIYNNPMLYNLLTQHMFNKRNPHEVTASQIGALKRIIVDGDQRETTGNKDGECSYVPEVILKQGNNIELSAENNTIRIDADCGAGAKNGLLSFSLEGQELRVEGPIPHQVTGDGFTAPMIILGEESDSSEQQTIKHMEGLFLFSILDKLTDRTPPGSRKKENDNLKKLGLDDFMYVKNEDNPYKFVFFKAINISPTHFSILLVNYSKNSKSIRIRWMGYPTAAAVQNGINITAK